MGRRERAVARERLLARAPPLDDGAQLAPAGESEVQRRADSLGRQWETVTGRVADEEHAVLGRRPELVRDPVSLIALGRDAEVAGEPDGRVLDVVRGPERADADAQLVLGGEAPRVARAHVARVDPQLHLLAARVRMHLQPAREARVRRLDRRSVGQHAPPAEPVDDERRAQRAAVGVHGAPLAPGDGRRLELDLAVVRLRPQQRAQLAVVERREGPRQRPARRRKRRVHDELVERLTMRGLQVHRVQPARRHRAGRGLSLADLVAVDHQHARAGAGQLARDRQAGEARAAHQDVAVALKRRARRPRVVARTGICPAIIRTADVSLR